jgi:serine/threonine protein kinase
MLGRGGMGIVFKARDTILERTVAIKILGPVLAENAAARKRFIREGQTAAAVKHEHVVTVYGVEGREESPYLVLEYIEGTALEDRLLKSAPLPTEEVAKLGVQIARGLAAAHQKGLVHRDIKPANILLEKETDRVAIGDFGLARAVDDASISQQGEICGTPHYMAPEQVAGQAIDHRADLFSLGSVLYYMCTGELPFSAPNSMAVLHRVTLDQPRPIREINPTVPSWLADLIAALHVKDPSNRIQSAADVAARLSTHGGSTSTTHVVRPPERLTATEPDSSSTASRLPYVVVLGLVFLLSLPAFYFILPREEPTNTGRENERRVSSVNPKADKEVPSQPPAEKTPQQPAPREPEEDRPVVTPQPAPMNGDKEEKKPQPIQKKVKGVVLVEANDPRSVSFVQEERLSFRNQQTSEVVTLQAGRNELLAGEYKFEESSLPPGLKIAPRRLTVSATESVFIYVTHIPPEKTPAHPGIGPPPDFPPPPPPPGGPPRMGRPR